MAIPVDGLIDFGLADSLYRFSGGDGIVQYWVDRGGRYARSGLPVSRSEFKFVVRAFRYLDSITGLEFRRVRSRGSSDIDIHCVRALGPRTTGLTVTRSGWFDVYWKDQGGSRLTAGEGGTILHEIAHTIGLGHPYGDGYNSFYSRSDTIMSYNGIGNRYTSSDVAAMQYLWGL